MKKINLVKKGLIKPSANGETWTKERNSGKLKKYKFTVIGSDTRPSPRKNMVLRSICSCPSHDEWASGKLSIGSRNKIRNDINGLIKEGQIKEKPHISTNLDKMIAKHGTTSIKKAYKKRDRKQPVRYGSSAGLVYSKKFLGLGANIGSIYYASEAGSQRFNVAYIGDTFDKSEAFAIIENVRTFSRTPANRKDVLAISFIEGSTRQIKRIIDKLSCRFSNIYVPDNIGKTVMHDLDVGKNSCKLISGRVNLFNNRLKMPTLGGKSINFDDYSTKRLDNMVSVNQIKTESDKAIDKMIDGIEMKDIKTKSAKEKAMDVIAEMAMPRYNGH